MPKPIPPALSESLPDQTQVSAPDVLRTLGGVGLPGSETVARMESNQVAPSMEVFADSRERTQKVMSLNGLTVPELDSSEFSHVNWGILEETVKAYEGLGVLAEVVIAPKGQSLQFWKGLYGSLRQWKETNQPDATHKLQNKTDGDGLWVGDEATSHWVQLVSTDSPGWTVTVMPATPKPMALGCDHSGKDKDGNMSPELVNVLNQLPSGDGDTLEEKLHQPDLEAQLTSKAIRLLEDNSPLDENIWSWSRNKFTTSSGTLAASRVVWRPGFGRVDVFWLEVDDRFDFLGSRASVSQ